MAKKHTIPKSPHASVTLLEAPWDMGAAGQANRHGLEQEEVQYLDRDTLNASNPNGVRRMRRVDMLEVWHKNFLNQSDRGQWISTEQFNAAEKLRDSFLKTQMGKGTDYSAERVDSSPKPDQAVAIQVDRFSGYYAIAKHIRPKDELIISVCVIQGHTPAQARVGGRRPYWGPTYGMGMQHLRDALQRLSDALGAGKGCGT